MLIIDAIREDFDLVKKEDIQKIFDFDENGNGTIEYKKEELQNGVTM